MNRFELVICEPDTDIVLNVDGTRCPTSEDHSYPNMQFDSLNDALRKKDEPMARLRGV